MAPTTVDDRRGVKQRLHPLSIRGHPRSLRPRADWGSHPLAMQRAARLTNRNIEAWIAIQRASRMTAIFSFLNLQVVEFLLFKHTAAWRFVQNKSSIKYERR